MTRSRITAMVLGFGVLAASVAPALAQNPPPTVIVPAPPAASPPTVVAPSASGTTVIAPPGSTVIVQPPAPTTAVVAVRPWCSGAYAAPGGTNFGSCPSYLVTR